MALGILVAEDGWYIQDQSCDVLCEEQTDWQNNMKLLCEETNHLARFGNK